MLRFSLALAVLLTMAAPAGAGAQGRLQTRSLTCPALKALVAKAGTAILASSEFVYETVHSNGGDCQQDETSAPAYEPTSDERDCFVGWRCKQRNSDGGNTQ